MPWFISTFACKGAPLTGWYERVVGWGSGRYMGGWGARLTLVIAWFMSAWGSHSHPMFTPNLLSSLKQHVPILLGSKWTMTTGNRGGVVSKWRCTGLPWAFTGMSELIHPTRRQCAVCQSTASLEKVLQLELESECCCLTGNFLDRCHPCKERKGPLS